MCPVDPRFRKLKRGTSVIGFLSHLQGDLKVKALEAGCDMVMPRSAFSQNLPNLLRRHGLAVPRGILVQTGETFPDGAAEWPGFVLKAQVLEGGRGKRGLVRRFDKAAEFRDARRLILRRASHGFDKRRAGAIQVARAQQDVCIGHDRNLRGRRWRLLKPERSRGR